MQRDNKQHITKPSALNPIQATSVAAQYIAVFTALVTGTLWALTAIAQPLERAAHSIDIVASVGFQQRIQLDNWTPVTVTVRNTGSAVTGHLEIVLADTQARVNYKTRYQQPLELASGAQKRLHYTVYLSRVTDPLQIRIVTGAGLVARHSVDLHSRLSPQRFIAVPGRDINLDYLNDRDRYRTQVVYPLPGFLPVHWHGYDGVEAIILHRLALRALAPNQYSALRNWIMAGGTLVVSGGYDTAILRTPRIAQLLPAKVVGTQQLETNRALHRALGFGVEDNEHLLTSMQPVGLSRVEPSASSGDSRVVHHIDNVPLVLEHKYGRGNVVLLTFDIASEPFKSWSGMTPFMQRVAKLSMVSPVTLQHDVSADQRRKSAMSRLMREQGPDYPNHATVIAFAAFYLAIVALYTRRDNNRNYLLAFAIPVGFSAAAVALFHQILFPQTSTIASVAVIEPNTNSSTALLHLTLRAQSTRPDPLEIHAIGANPLLRPAATTPNQRYTAIGPRLEPWVFQQGATPTARPLQARAYTEFKAKGSDVIDFAVSADYQANGVVEFHNRSGREITHLLAVTDNQVFNLGSVISGDTAEQTLSTGMPLGQAAWRYQLRNQHPAGDAAVAAVTAILAGEFGAHFTQPTAAAVLLLGFTSSPWLIDNTKGHSHIDLSLMAWKIDQRTDSASEPNRARGLLHP